MHTVGCPDTAALSPPSYEHTCCMMQWKPLLSSLKPQTPLLIVCGTSTECMTGLNGSLPGLNTVEMLKIASSGLGMAPAQAMRIAESLYTSGYLSYPRTGQSSFVTSQRPSSGPYRQLAERRDLAETCRPCSA